jgi:phosphatidylglycerophosphate synthase
VRLPFFILRAAIVFAAVMSIALRYVRRDHPFPSFGPANLVTAVRAALASLMLGLIGEPADPAVAWTAASLAMAATVLDGVDGFFARRTGMSSTFGARFDMEVDAIVILTLSILVWAFNKAGVWAIASGLMRYAFVGAGWLWPWLAAPLAPTYRAKAICVVQIVVLLVAILPFVPRAISSATVAGALALLAYSFLADGVRLWRTR